LVVFGHLQLDATAPHIDAVVKALTLEVWRYASRPKAALEGIGIQNDKRRSKGSVGSIRSGEEEEVRKIVAAAPRMRAASAMACGNKEMRFAQRLKNRERHSGPQRIRNALRADLFLNRERRRFASAATRASP
jgi:hypothetical protein